MSGIKILSASAGSGKTYSLAYDYVRTVVGQPDLYRRILAVTFTNKATEEMKSRIVSRICEIASGAKSPYMDDLKRDLALGEAAIRSKARVAESYILHDYSHFTVVTIDKFFQRIIRSFIKELGIELNFNLELQSDSIIEAATDNLIENITTDSDLRGWIVDFARWRIEQNKGWDIRRSLYELGGEIFREGVEISSAMPRQQLEAKVAQLTSRAKEIEGTIKDMACQSMALIAASGLSVEDFSYGRSGVVGFIARVQAGDLSRYGKRVTDAMDDDARWVGKSATGAAKAVVPQLRAMLGQICLMMDQNRPFLATVSLVSENYRGYALLRDLKEQIDKLCGQENIMPISQTNKILNALIRDNSTPFIFEKSGNHFTRFMIDEFQDTSRLQWSNFVPLLENAIAQSEQPPVLLVGDIKQSIYRWRGGDWKIMASEVANQFPIEVTALETNYRSLPLVVQFNNSVMRSVVDADNHTLNTLLSETPSLGADFVAAHTNLLASAYNTLEQKSNKEDNSGYVTVTRYEDKDSEGERQMPPVVSCIEDMQRRGYRAGDIAIIVRTNKQAVEIANHLLEHKAANPNSPFNFDVVTQEALVIGNSRVVRFVVAIFELAANPRNDLARGLYNNFLGRSVEQPIKETELIASIEKLSPIEAFERTVSHFELADTPTNTAYLQALSDQIIAFCNKSIADLPLFVKRWKEKGCNEAMQMPRRANAIAITTVHKSKGLEFDAVIVPYCNWELGASPKTTLWAHSSQQDVNDLPPMPIKYKNESADSYFAQEYFSELVMSHIDSINTLYVAFTRPRRELHVMMPRRAKEGSRVDSLINAAILSNGEKSTLGRVEGVVQSTQTIDITTFGEPTTQRQCQETECGIAAVMPCKPRESLRLSLISRRDAVADDNMDTPRSMGVLLHKIFEQSPTKEAMLLRLKALTQDGIVSPSEATELQLRIDQAMNDPLASSWFSDRWQRVMTESDIIVPAQRHIKRPDRVMIDQQQAIVVDFKFGNQEQASHRRQIGQYKELLVQMGHSNVKGYIWYVLSGKIVEL